ncbi:MAG: thiamine-phosphate kinase [Thermomicrobiales bacterium]|nr:thiamine-phosphate kinase [Thermomicrobiales bacterium]
MSGGGKRISSVGEFALIRSISNILASSRVKSSGTLLGPGDDTAIWQPRPGRTVAMTTDVLVEGVHYRTDWSTAEQIGHRALAVNISDLAAMGARPRVALVSLGLRGDEMDRWVYDMYRGMLTLAGKNHLRIIGGDVVRSPRAQTISVTAIGELRPGQEMRRDAARVGDMIGVTGPLGLAAGGVRLLEQGGDTFDGAPVMKHAHREPRPQVLAGLLLARAGVRCAMDISDGLLGDLPKICEASGVSVLLEQDDLPIPNSLRWNFPDWFDLALRGGEDFELVFTAPPEVFARAVDLFRRFGLRLPIVIGEAIAPTPQGPRISMRFTDLHRDVLEPGAVDHFPVAPTTRAASATVR